MWEDEEGTIYFSQQLRRPFAKLFPTFFVLLHGLYEITGVTVAAGRMLSAGIGVLGIALFYGCFQRFISRSAALVAALLLTVNLGHLFWSQSIRYYNLLVVFELLSMYWFLVGFEEGKISALVLSNVAFALAMLTHFSAALLAPVYVAYLGLLLVRRPAEGGYSVQNYALFASLLAIILGFFAWKLRQAQAMLSGGGVGIPSARDPIHVFVTVIAYFGPWVVGLALLSPFLRPQRLPQRVLLFFLVAAIVPVLELLVIAELNVINVTWYYALISLYGFAALAAFTLVGCYERGRRRLVVMTGVGMAIASGMLLAGYYTTMHGDRPRWEEAADHLRHFADIHVDARQNPEVYASVPGVVAYYLGIDPGETKAHPLVQMIPDAPPYILPTQEQWYVVESGHLTAELQDWLDRNSREEVSFEARTGPRDRTVHIYHYCPSALSTAGKK
jgi:4-amino-4-deoxy-L-arabinose transferase-like glycosyltransferase